MAAIQVNENEERVENSSCRSSDKHLFMRRKCYATAGMSQVRDAAIKPGKVPLQGLTCHFSLKDLVRVDFVFPYGRIAATRIGVRPEPFDRDAESEFDQLGMEEIRDRIADLFK